MRCALVAVLGIAAWSLSYGGVSADTPEGSFCKAVKPCFREHSRRGGDAETNISALAILPHHPKS
jgi:hypothetical protein